MYFFFFSSRRRHTRYWRDWSSDVCSSDLADEAAAEQAEHHDEGGQDVGARAEELDLREEGELQEDAADHDQRNPQGDLRDRKSVVWGKSVDLGGRRIIKKKKQELYAIARH